MKSGKISEAVLRRSVIKTVNQQEKQHMVSKAEVGRDAGLFAVEEMTGVMAASCTTLSGCEAGLAEVAVHRACNSLAAAGAVLADVWLDDVTMPVIDSLGEEFLSYVKDDMDITVKEDGTVVVA